MTKVFNSLKSFLKFFSGGIIKEMEYTDRFEGPPFIMIK